MFCVRVDVLRADHVSFVTKNGRRGLGEAGVWAHEMEMERTHTEMERKDAEMERRHTEMEWKWKDAAAES